MNGDAPSKPSKHAVKVRLIPGTMFACEVEIDGKPIVGLRSVGFRMDMERRPELTLTFRPHAIDFDADVPMLIVTGDEPPLLPAVT